MSKQCEMKSTLVGESRHDVLRTFVVVMLLQPWSYLLAQQTSHVKVASAFLWPTSRETMAAANQTPRTQIDAFYQGIQKQTAGGSYSPGSIRLSQFRFTRLGKEKICLASTGGERFPWFLDVTCPSPGGFDVTTLQDERMGLLATDLLDLNGDGLDKVISSTFAVGYQGSSTPPLYWYTIYSFEDGLPHDVSWRFVDFYRAEVLDWGDRLERLVMPPLGSGSKENNYIEAQIIFTQLKYHRKILGETKAGLQEATRWAESSDARLQEMAISTLREINDPASISVLKKLTSSKYQGVCREAVTAIAAFDHRDVTGKELESECKAPST